MSKVNQYKKELAEHKRLLLKYCTTLERKLARDEDEIVASQDVLDDDKRKLLGEIKLLGYLLRKLTKPHLTQD
jgi:hypothetical protein